MGTWHQSFSELFWLVRYIVKDLELLHNNPAYMRLRRHWIFCVLGEWTERAIKTYLQPKNLKLGARNPGDREGTEKDAEEDI